MTINPLRNAHKTISLITMVPVHDRIEIDQQTIPGIAFAILRSAPLKSSMAKVVEHTVVRKTITAIALQERWYGLPPQGAARTIDYVAPASR